MQELTLRGAHCGLLLSVHLMLFVEAGLCPLSGPRLLPLSVLRVYEMMSGHQNAMEILSHR